MPNLIQLPTYTEFIDQKLVIEPLEGPKPAAQYTDRFPDELYHKAPESHLIRFLHATLGPSGAGWLRKNTLDARLVLEAQGLDLFDLDLFYGDPFSFGRIFDEVWDFDPTGTLTRAEWEEIKSKDESYRSRALDFMNGARAGNTPFGMRLVARSGLGHEVEIVENYKYLFDVHSDDPIGLINYGRTNQINEFIVLPRQEAPRSEAQSISITGSPSSGNFILFFNGRNTATIPYNATVFDIQSALEDLSEIGPNGVHVTGANGEFVVRFRGHLAKSDVPQLTAQSGLGGGTLPEVLIDTVEEGIPPVGEVFQINARNAHNLQSALDRVKPVTAVPTLGEAAGLKSRQTWRSAFASSEYNEVLRYVTGNPAIRLPIANNVKWIERNIEKEAPRVKKDLQYHYTGFHNVFTVTSSSDQIGRFSPAQRTLPGYDYLTDPTNDSVLTYSADRILADYFEPLTVSTVAESGNTQMINGIYPIDYLESPSVPQIKYAEEQFWASQEAASGTETITIDLGSARAVNFLSFEISRKPVNITVEVDVLGIAGEQEWEEVTPSGTFDTSVDFTPSNLNPWETVQYYFEDPLREIYVTQTVRINFERRQSVLDPFLDGQPWSVDVRNLRIGRSVSDY